MLVVDLHTLQTVNFLNLIHDVLLYLHGTLDVQDVGRGERTFGKRRTGFHVVVLLCQNLLGCGDEILFLFTRLGGDVHATVTTFELLLEGDHTVDFGYDSRIGGITGLEELGDARQTAGDIA